MYIETLALRFSSYHPEQVVGLPAIPYPLLGCCCPSLEHPLHPVRSAGGPGGAWLCPMGNSPAYSGVDGGGKWHHVERPAQEQTPVFAGPDCFASLSGGI